MGLYEQRLAADLDSIRGRVSAAATSVQRALDRAVRGLMTDDRPLCWQVVLEDRPINREMRGIDAACHAFVARHYPAAGHLRMVSAVLRLDVELERIGDYAVTIARNAVQLSEPPPRSMLADIELIASQSGRMLASAVDAWNEGSAERALATSRMARSVDLTFDKVYQDLLGKKGKRPLKDLFLLLSTFSCLERVSDQAKNICEETIFAAQGEAKPDKQFRILFLDRGNDRLSQLAEAHARKAFPASGWYASLGWEPAEQLDPEALQLARQAGLDMGGAVPRPLAPEIEEIGHFDIVVGLEDGALARLGRVPYHTVFLQWTLPQESLEAAHRDLIARIRGLMDLVRGPGAA